MTIFKLHLEKTSFLQFAYAKTKAQNSAADQHVCFCYIDSTSPLLPISKSKVSSLKPSSVAVQPGLCQCCSETPLTDFFRDTAHFVCL